MDNPNGPANLWVVPDRASEFLYWGMREQTKLPGCQSDPQKTCWESSPSFWVSTSESLVLLVVSDGELQVAARCDLTDVTIPGGAAELVGRLWFQYPDADALAVAYSSSSQLAWDALAEVSGVLPDAATVIRLHVTPDRYFTGPEAGYAYRLRVPGESGLPVLPDRTDIAAMLLPRYPTTSCDAPRPPSRAWTPRSPPSRRRGTSRRVSWTPRRGGRGSGVHRTGLRRGHHRLDLDPTPKTWSTSGGVW